MESIYRFEIRKNRDKIKSIIIISLFILSSSPFTNRITNAISTDTVSVNMNKDFKQDAEISFNTIFLGEKPSYNPNSLNFDPILDLSGSGNDFLVDDNLHVHHPLSVSLNSDNSLTNSYSIGGLADYSEDILQYNITSITTSQEFITQQTIHNKDEVLESTNIRVAQSFDVVYDYAVFSGAKIYLIIKTAIGADELELFLVKASIVDGKPDMGFILSNATNDPFGSINPITESTPGNTVFYDFHNVVLTTGKYYVVANLSSFDAVDSDGFNWRGQQGSVYTDSYTHDGTVWSGIINKDFILAPELMQTYANGSPIIYQDPTSIQLRDNGVDITSTTQIISGIGSHELTSNTTVAVNLNNSYSFSRSFVGSSSYTAINSTFYDYSVSWNISWLSSSVDFSGYDNPTRSQTFTIPKTWNDFSFSLLLNDATPLSYLKSDRTFTLNMIELLSGSSYLEGDISFQSTSRNLLYEVIQSSDTFNLGYWETNETHATGYQGSPLNSIIDVKEAIDSEVTNGNLNFTLFDPEGQIISFKNSLPSELIYNDISYYTQIISTQSGPGEYSASTLFDPSVYGSDKEGYWTVVYLWQNGTDVGFTSRIITVVKPTFAEFEWEDIEGSDNWVNDSLSTIDRINGEGIKVRICYYNISDPFFTGNGTLITSASVTYSTGWLETGLIAFGVSSYEREILTNVQAGTYTIDLSAQSQFLENHTVQFTVRILHVFQLNKEKNDYYTNYTNDFIIRFDLIDITNMSNPVEPDQIILKIDETILLQSDYSQEISNGKIILEFNSGSLNLGIGVYNLDVNITKTNFIDSTGQGNILESFSLNTLTIATDITIEETVEEIDKNSQTIIKFSYFDTNHSTLIRNADVDVRVDISNVEVWLDPEVNGIYSIIVKTLEPSVSSLNIYVNVSKVGYEAKADFRLVGISINIIQTPPPSPTGLPIYIFIIAGIIGAVILIIPIVLFARRKVIREKRAQKSQFTQIYNFYEGILSVTKLIIVHSATSLPVYEMDLGSEITLDPSLITGFLSAVSSVGGEMKGDKTASVKRVEYMDFQVTASKSGQFTLYTFSEAELNEEIEKKLTVISDWFAMLFSNIPEDWDGSTEPFRLNLQGITEKIMKEIHLWIFYPFRVAPNKTIEIEQMSGLRKKLINYIQEIDNITISRLFDDIDYITFEQGLPVIFELIESNILEPEYDAYKIATVRF